LKARGVSQNKCSLVHLYLVSSGPKQLEVFFYRLDRDIEHVGSLHVQYGYTDPSDYLSCVFCKKVHYQVGLGSEPHLTYIREGLPFDPESTRIIQKMQLAPSQPFLQSFFFDERLEFGVMWPEHEIFRRVLFSLLVHDD